MPTRIVQQVFCCEDGAEKNENGAGIREGVRSYSVYGKQTLDDAAEAWTSVAEGEEGNFRFFKVGVAMPEQK